MARKKKDSNGQHKIMAAVGSKTPALRFAPLIRVSDVTQEKQGESLRVQKAQVQDYVKALGGTIPAHCWQYSGQEHATVGYERQKLEALLRDSGKGLFDAIIVTDPSRWSRDNAKSKAGLEVLRSNGTRFFVGTMEYDLWDPTQSFLLGVSTEVNEYHANLQALKCIQGRIAKARRGIPTSGILPYARTFDKKTETWGVDAEKAAGIRWAAGRYVKGEPLPKLAKALGICHTTLWKVLTQRSGDTWEVQFQNKKVNVDETVVMKIPRLLPDNVIKAVHARAQGNKTFFHDNLKHKYLLSRMTFCASCGAALTGMAAKSKFRYYKHRRNGKCGKTLWVPADALERAVLAHLFATFGDVQAMEKAVERAIPDTSRLRELTAHRATLEKKLARVKSGKSNIVDRIADGTISGEDAKAKMQKLREQEALLIAEIEHTVAQLATVPDRQRVRDVAPMVKQLITEVYKGFEHLLSMPYEARRSLVQYAFNGKNAEGRRYGVYVDKGKDGTLSYTINGVLIGHRGGHLPMPIGEAQYLTGVEPEYTGADFDPLKEPDEAKQDLRGFDRAKSEPL